MKLEPLKDWVLELDPDDEHDASNYFSSKPNYSSEIYAKTEEGDFAQVAYIPLVLTEADHKKIRQLEDEEREAREEYWDRHQGKPDNRPWYKKLIPLATQPLQAIRGHKLKAIYDKYDAAELVYKPRHSKELHDAHLHLVLSAPYMYKLLRQYQDTGRIEKPEVKKVLNIANGKDTPHITRVPKWRQRSNDLFQQQEKEERC